MIDRDTCGQAGAVPLDRMVGRRVFGQDAAAYDDARADYPAALFDRLDERCRGLRDRVALEIGPGSGLATRELLARGVVSLTAFEPDPGMTAHLRVTIDDPRLHLVGAPFAGAECLPQHYHLGLAAASFHWLDPSSALRDVARVLQPDGQWAMWWNVYRTDTPVHPLAELIRPMIAHLPQPPSEQATGHRSLDAMARLGELRDAGFRDIEYQLVQRDRMLSPARIRALYATFSFVRSLDPASRDRLLDTIAGVALQEFGDAVPSPILTAAYFATTPGG